MSAVHSSDVAVEPRAPSTGTQMHDFIAGLYPLCRSITGNGTLETLKLIRERIPIVISKIPTGIRVYDWEIPNEWNITDAYVKDSSGAKIIDFRKSNLHVVNYSVPVHRTMSRQELCAHLHTLPEHPDWIPYKTSYYQEDWGFCLSYNQYKMLKDEMFEVCIDSSLNPGHLSYGELLIRGQTLDEVLISTHICHPSLCNDNLSGIAVATFLAQHLLKTKPRYTYRFLFIPGTIGAITWLSLNELQSRRIKHGLVASLLGSQGSFVYKKSRRGNAEIDQVVEYVLRKHDAKNEIREFSPYGYDERQYCSPGFNLAVGCLTRTPYGEFPEYHTSADDLDFVKADALEESLQLYSEVIRTLEANVYYNNLSPKCEPRLGSHGLYEKTGGSRNVNTQQLALLWVLNLSDGKHSLLDIAKKSALEFDAVRNAALQLQKVRLLEVYKDNKL